MIYYKNYYNFIYLLVESQEELQKTEKIKHINKNNRKLKIM